MNLSSSLPSGSNLITFELNHIADQINPSESTVIPSTIPMFSSSSFTKIFLLEIDLVFEL